MLYFRFIIIIIKKQQQHKDSNQGVWKDLVPYKYHVFPDIWVHSGQYKGTLWWCSQVSFLYVSQQFLVTVSCKLARATQHNIWFKDWSSERTEELGIYANRPL
jgi:hypothetical protein